MFGPVDKYKYDLKYFILVKVVSVSFTFLDYIILLLFYTLMKNKIFLILSQQYCSVEHNLNLD